MRSVRAVGSVVLSVVVFVPIVVAAAGVYRWVDDNGKVHYTQTPPSTGDTTKIKAPPAGSDDAPPVSPSDSVRGADGNCLTIKCMADEMESARLQREGDYARQRAENERHLQKKQVQTEPQRQAGPPGSLYSDEHMRTQCLHGQCGSDTRDCDNVQRLRECAATQAAQRQHYQERKHSGGGIDAYGNRRY